MATSAKRLGLAHDPVELEQRLRRLELAVEKRQQANFQQSAASLRRSRSAPPQVTGLSVLDTIAGAIAIKWSPANIPDLQRYDVQVATNLAFSNAISYRTNEPLFTFPEGTDPTADYYARVRAVNSRGEPGLYSSPLNAALGRANDIDSDRDDTETTINQGTSEVFVPITKTVRGGRLIAFITTSIKSYNVAFGQAVTTRFRQDTATLQEFTNELSVTGGGGTGTTGTGGLPGLALPVDVPPGTYVFDVEIEVDAGGASYVTVDDVRLTVWEIRGD